VVAAGAAAVVLMAAPLSAANGVQITVDPSQIAPGATTSVEIVFDSTGTSNQYFDVRLTPQGTATGSMTFSDPQSSTTSPGGTGFTCFVDGSDESLLSCIYNNVNKDAGDTATVTVTVTATADALGTFDLTVFDAERLAPVELDSAEIVVAVPVTPDTPVEPPVELSPNFTG